jgi:hypothetical protein
MARTTPTTSPIGSMFDNAAAPATASAIIISSVAYATEERASEENTGRASVLGRSVCSSFADETWRPTSTRLMTVPTPAKRSAPETPARTGGGVLLPREVAQGLLGQPRLSAGGTVLSPDDPRAQPRSDGQTQEETEDEHLHDLWSVEPNP